MSRQNMHFGLQAIQSQAGSTRATVVTFVGRLALLLVLAGASCALTWAQTETVVYNFAGGTDGIGPRAGLIRDVKGNLYGTTLSGGAFGFGTVYEVTAAGVEKILHSFNGTDGNAPYGSLVLAGSNLYGTTYAGGTNSLGTVYQVTLKGTFKVLYNFAGTDGSNPFAGLVRDPKTGNLYGTTGTGGAFNAGTVFELTPTGTETVLYSFNVGPGGYSPVAPLVRDPKTGNLYGTTYNGGASNYCIGGCGTVFELTPTGTETVLHSFSVPRMAGIRNQAWCGTRGAISTDKRTLAALEEGALSSRSLPQARRLCFTASRAARMVVYPSAECWPAIRRPAISTEPPALAGPTTTESFLS